jgi:N-acetylglucosamine kinase-like BadF-type ATPase
MSDNVLGGLVLGMDGGGTSTIALLADAGNGRILGRGIGGASNPKAVGNRRALAAISHAIDEAFAAARLERGGPVALAVLGLAGLDRPEDHAMLSGWNQEIAVPWARELVLVNDGQLVLAAGTPHNAGVAVIAGTGSIIQARHPDGRTARAGGWGHLIGDEGSAYGVALSAMRLIAQIADGRLQASDPALEQEVLRAVGVESALALVSAIYAPEMDRTRIAGIAPAVARAADAGSHLADQLLREGGRELAAGVRAVVAQLKLREVLDPLPLACTGGFLLSTPLLQNAMLDALGDQSVRLERVVEPAQGAVILARRAMGSVPFNPA